MVVVVVAVRIKVRTPVGNCQPEEEMDVATSGLLYDVVLGVYGLEFKVQRTSHRATRPLAIQQLNELRTYNII